MTNTGFFKKFFVIGALAVLMVSGNAAIAAQNDGSEAVCTDTSTTTAAASTRRQPDPEPSPTPTSTPTVRPTGTNATP